MSKENSTARRDTSIPPRKVSLRREDSGYNSVIGTPAGTPAVGMNGRRTSRVEQNRDPHLEDIPEHHDHVSVGSLPTDNHMNHMAAASYNALPHDAGAHHVLQDQLSIPDEEKSTHSAPNRFGGLSGPYLQRTYSMEPGYYTHNYSGGTFFRTVSKKAEEIISKFEKMRMDSTETVHTQSPSPVEEPEEEPEEENSIQFPVPEVSQPSAPLMVGLQRQFSEFPLDQNVLTVGQDGYYLEDRDYNIVKEAGAGGSACCHLGNDKVNPTQQFIIKKPKKSLSEEEKQSMMRESRILKDIDHDNVIRFYGAVEDLKDQCFKIFLEYADETCGDINYLFCENEDKESFSGNIALIMLYTQQMLIAVDYLHWMGILHLDIKGKNIVVCNGGYRVKLIDFGAACEASGALPQRTEWTPVFAAPEVNNQLQPPKFSADVWSVMCVAVEMVTGNLPWPEETNHQTALFKIGCYEDNQITELVQYDNYWDKYSFYQEHHDMYQELVSMWKMVFRKDSSSRPSATDLLSQKWMRQMELNGEQILHDLCSSGEEEQACIEESHSIENDNVGILINNHSPVEYSTQGYSEEDSRLSGHAYSGHNSPYQSNSPRVSLSQGFPPSAGHSPTGRDSETYYSCNASFSGRNDNYLSERQYLQPNGSGPSSLPAMGLYSPMHNYQSSTPMVGGTAPQPAFATDRLRDYTDGRDDSSSSRIRSRSLSVHNRPPGMEEVTPTGRRRKSLCYIGSSLSEPTNVLNASGIMGSINKANVKRVNSLIYVSEGPKTDSPVSSPRIEEQSLVPATVANIEISQMQQPRHRLSSSDGGSLSRLNSSVDSGYGLSLDEPFIRRSLSTGSRTLSRSSRLSLPDRDEHKPDGCSEPNDSQPHTLQLTSPTSNKTQQIEVNGSTTVKDIIKMTQHSKSTNDSIILKLDSTTVKTH